MSSISIEFVFLRNVEASWIVAMFAANATAIGRLLKTLEEPPASTIIVLLSEDVPDEQITIASRCVTVTFQAVPHADVVAWLAQQGVTGEMAETVALASGGDLRRAGDLAGDDQVARRHDAWRSAPERLDGSGAAVAVLWRRMVKPRNGAEPVPVQIIRSRAFGSSGMRKVEPNGPVTCTSSLSSRLQR